MNKAVVLPVVREMILPRPALNAVRHLHVFAYDYSDTTLELLQDIGSCLS
jgi:hypothetical protein